MWKVERQVFTRPSRVNDRSEPPLTLGTLRIRSASTSLFLQSITREGERDAREAGAEEDGEGDRETAVGGRLCNVARVALGVIHAKLRFIRGHKCFNIETRSFVIKVNLRKLKLRERHRGKLKERERVTLRKDSFKFISFSREEIDLIKYK